MDRFKFRLYFKGSDYAEAGYVDLTRTDVNFSLRSDGQIIRDVVYECQREEHKGESCHIPYTPDNNLYDIQFCTGMKDKNDKQIYEGDIIRCYYLKMHLDGVVFWDSEELGFNVKAYDGEIYRFIPTGKKETVEVIGNIYENPELLEG